jgi:ABC-type uncharacterized transport system involved in gliding motility auxiliary subunit
MDSRQRLQYRIQSGVFLVLFIALLAALGWLTDRHAISIDLSAGARNSLSPESARLLVEIEQPLKATLFASPLNEARPLLEALFERYRELQPLIEFESLNPDLHPDLLREYDIRYDGEVVLEYRGLSETVAQVNEASVSSAIQRLLRQGERWLVFLAGHGERNPYSEANHDYSLLAQRLASSGYTVETLNLTQTGSIPDNTDILVLASPKVPLLPGEIGLLLQYVERGGNLLWLADPEQASDGLELLADRLTIELLPGIVVDPNSQLMGLDRVDFALVSDYPRHPVTQNVASLSLFPQAQALAYHGEDSWQPLILLRSDSRSWNETGPLRGEIFHGDDDDEIQGPLDIALTLARQREDDEQSLMQRVAIVGDADFLANQYLGNGSNLEIGVNLVNWLSHDDGLISISPRPAPDTRLELSAAQQLTIAIFFLILLPLSLLGGGLRIWIKRRKL